MGKEELSEKRVSLRQLGVQLEGTADGGFRDLRLPGVLPFQLRLGELGVGGSEARVQEDDLPETVFRLLVLLMLQEVDALNPSLVGGLGGRFRLRLRPLLGRGELVQTGTEQDDQQHQETRGHAGRS